MKDFLPRYLKYMLLVAASVASVLGLAVAVWTDVRWMVVFYCAVIFVVSLAFCFSAHREQQEALRQRDSAKVEAERERERRVNVEAKLQTVAADILLRIQESLQKYSLQQAARHFAGLAERVGRMLALAEKENTFAVRTIEAQGTTLYIVAKASIEAQAFVRAGDIFFLIRITPSRVGHRVAVLQVAQNFQSRNRGVAFQVVQPLDTEFHDRLANLARSTHSLKGLADLQVVPPIEAGDLKGVDVQNASAVIAKLQPLLDALWLGDACDGD